MDFLVIELNPTTDFLFDPTLYLQPLSVSDTDGLSSNATDGLSSNDGERPVAETAETGG